MFQDPPAAAIEFLSKIREVIAIAKQKMATKRFHPVLNHIPEEETYPSNGSVDLCHGMDSQRSGSIVSLKRENSRKRSSNCVGCPGCTSNKENGVQPFMKYNLPTCSNCLGDKGDKQNSIRKWLENIPSGKQQVFYSDTQTQHLASSLLSLPSDEKQCQLQKQNSFCASHTSAIDEFARSRRNSSRSVRSEPSIRNYNIPLPEFNETESNHCQTVTRSDGIRPIDFNGYRSGSERSRNNGTLLKNNTLPDMVNEAIALDHISRSSYNLSSSDEERCSKNLTTDEVIRNNSEIPSGNEYETDSLERTSNKKGKASRPSEFPDVPSSQASPSLSNALPLEEELTMRNAVYKTNCSDNSNTPSPEVDMHVDDNHYEIIEIKKPTVKPELEVTLKQNTNYSLVSEVYVNNNYNFSSAPTSPSGSESSVGSRKEFKLNIEERPGCLTIEVKDPPENYIKIHESDGFEPDTLDRKHPKHKEILESIHFSRREFLKNIDTPESRTHERIQLRSSGTFTKSNGKNESLNKFNSLRNEHDHQRHFLSRSKLSPVIYSGSKSLEDVSDDNWDDNNGWTSEDSRILTLELRHSKRQRQSTPPTIKQLKNLARPDILPPLPPIEDAIYEKPRIPPRRVQCEITATDHSSSNMTPRNSICESSHSPKTSSSQPLHSEHEDAKCSQSNMKSDECRTSKRIKTCYSTAGINTNTFVRSQKGDNFHRTKIRRKKGTNIEDSGYLSSDSTSSKQFQRKIVIAKIESCTESEDTGDEARSESGAESMETHSVYFGNCQKLQLTRSNENIKNTVKVPKDSRRKIKVRSENHSQ